MSKQYPLEIQNTGGDEYQVMSKGHHDIHEFMRKVRADGYDWPLGTPQHLWCKTTPCNTGEYTCHYNYVNKGVRGAFPVTVAHEDYGAGQYHPPKEFCDE